MLRGIVLLLTILVIDTVIALDFVLNDGRNAKASIPFIMMLLGFIFVLPSLISAPRAKSDALLQGERDDNVKLEQEARALLTRPSFTLNLTCRFSVYRVVCM